MGEAVGFVDEAAVWLIQNVCLTTRRLSHPVRWEGAINGR